MPFLAFRMIDLVIFIPIHGYKKTGNNDVAMFNNCLQVVGISVKEIYYGPKKINKMVKEKETKEKKNKKAPAKSLKEKRAAKVAKRADKK